MSADSDADADADAHVIGIMTYEKLRHWRSFFDCYFE